MRLFNREKRSISAGDRIVEAIVNRATNGVDAEPDGLALVQSAVALYCRAMVAASQTPVVLHTAMLEQIVRALILRGEAFVMLDSSGDLGAICSSATIQGKTSDPMAWSYELTIAAPSGQLVSKRKGDRLCHFKINVDPRKSWRGRSMLELAGATAKTAAAIEDAAAETSRLPIADVLSWTTLSRTREGGGTVAEDTINTLDDAIKKKTKLIVRASNPKVPNSQQGSLQSLRVDPVAGLNELRRDSARDLAVAMLGSGAGLLERGTQGVALREQFRQFIQFSVKPVAQAIATEIHTKIGTELVFDFQDLHAADHAQKARALKGYVDAGMTLDDAKKAVGLA